MGNVANRSRERCVSPAASIRSLSSSSVAKNSELRVFSLSFSFFFSFWKESPVLFFFLVERRESVSIRFERPPPIAPLSFFFLFLFSFLNFLILLNNIFNFLFRNIKQSHLTVFICSCIELHGEDREAGGRLLWTFALSENPLLPLGLHGIGTKCFFWYCLGFFNQFNPLSNLIVF